MVICLVAVVVCVVIGVSTWYGRGALVPPADKSSVVEPRDFLPGTEPWKNLHLPSYTIPRHYDLTLYPDFYGSNDQFYGNITMEIDIKQATYYLLVHYKYLNMKGKNGGWLYL